MNTAGELIRPAAVEPPSVTVSVATPGAWNVLDIGTTSRPPGRV